jgi:hypothetical protein
MQGKYFWEQGGWGGFIMTTHSGINVIDDDNAIRYSFYWIIFLHFP